MVLRFAIIMSSVHIFAWILDYRLGYLLLWFAFICVLIILHMNNSKCKVSCVSCKIQLRERELFSWCLGPFTWTNPKKGISVFMGIGKLLATSFFTIFMLSGLWWGYRWWTILMSCICYVICGAYNFRSPKPLICSTLSSYQLWSCEMIFMMLLFRKVLCLVETG